MELKTIAPEKVAESQWKTFDYDTFIEKYNQAKVGTVFLLPMVGRSARVTNVVQGLNKRGLACNKKNGKADCHVYRSQVDEEGQHVTVDNRRLAVRRLSAKKGKRLN